MRLIKKGGHHSQIDINARIFSPIDKHKKHMVKTNMHANINYNQSNVRTHVARALVCCIFRYIGARHKAYK